jgi:deoxyribonuclease-4
VTGAPTPRRGASKSGRPRPAPRTDLLLGAHMSIAGGLHHAVLAGAAHRATALQIFSRNSNQWAMKPLTDEAVALWKEAQAAHPMVTLVHDSYLINLASPDAALREKSCRAFIEEVRRCARLEIPYLVFHPGAHMGAGTEAGLDRIVRALDRVVRAHPEAPVTLLLENTAGQGTVLGSRFEHLARVLSQVERPERFGVCIDTCHLLAAGYDFRDPAGYRAVFGTFDRLVGIGSVRAFHLNDSKRDLGSRVDRHEHIGKGYVGTPAFRMLLQDPRFREAPKVLETPKKDDMDRKNLALLRRLAHMPVR